MAEAMKITDNIGFDAVLESSGAPAAVKPALEILAKAQQWFILRCIPLQYELPVNLLMTTYAKEITIRGFFNSPYSFPRAIAMLPRLNLKAIEQKIFPIDEARAAFDAHMSGQYAKVLIKCS